MNPHVGHNEGHNGSGIDDISSEQPDEELFGQDTLSLYPQETYHNNMYQTADTLGISAESQIYPSSSDPHAQRQPSVAQATDYNQAAHSLSTLDSAFNVVEQTQLFASHQHQGSIELENATWQPSNSPHNISNSFNAYNYTHAHTADESAQQQDVLENDSAQQHQQQHQHQTDIWSNSIIEGMQADLQYYQMALSETELEKGRMQKQIDELQQYDGRELSQRVESLQQALAQVEEQQQRDMERTTAGLEAQKAQYQLLAEQLSLKKQRCNELQSQLTNLKSSRVEGSPVQAQLEELAVAQKSVENDRKKLKQELKHNSELLREISQAEGRRLQSLDNRNEEQMSINDLKQAHQMEIEAFRTREVEMQRNFENELVRFESIQRDLEIAREQAQVSLQKTSSLERKLKEKEAALKEFDQERKQLAEAKLLLEEERVKAKRLEAHYHSRLGQFELDELQRRADQEGFRTKQEQLEIQWRSLELAQDEHSAEINRMTVERNQLDLKKKDFDEIELEMKSKDNVIDALRVSMMDREGSLVTERSLSLKKEAMLKEQISKLEEQVILLKSKSDDLAQTVLELKSARKALHTYEDESVLADFDEHVLSKIQEDLKREQSLLSNGISTLPQIVKTEPSSDDDQRIRIELENQLSNLKSLLEKHNHPDKIAVKGLESPSGIRPMPSQQSSVKLTEIASLVKNMMTQMKNQPDAFALQSNLSQQARTLEHIISRLDAIESQHTDTFQSSSFSRTR